MGDSVLLSNVSANAEGGRANSPDDVATDNPDTGGTGGNGGTVQIKGVTSLYLGQDPLPPAPPPALEPLRPVELLASGGHTALEGFEGGVGGQIKLILTNGPTDVFTFAGAATVEGGTAPLGLYGAEGRVCASGASLEAEIAIIGSNNFPIARCTTQDLTDFAMGADLACDNTPGQPSSISTETPVVIGVNFFRVYITDAMRVGTPEVPATPYATVSTQGAIDGELYLYVGPAAVFGSYDTAAYTLGSDQSAGPTKSVCFDTTGNVDDFVSVMVVEQTPFVEAFTITVQCSESPCAP
jgi:hypothetical protein